jgi:hypothetical protein
MKRALGLAFALGVVACHDEGRSQAKRLIAAVERFQGTDNDHRPQVAEEVARVPCTETLVSAACPVCVAATRATAEALVLKRAVELDLAAAEAGKILPGELAERHLDDKVQGALKLLDDGKAKMQECEQALVALRRAAQL